MIAFSDKDGRLTVTGTAGEWSQLLDRLDRPSLKRMSAREKAREILIVASAVPFKGEGGNRAR